MNPLLEKLKLLLPEADREQITTDELLIAALEKMLADKKEIVPDPAVTEAANELPGVKATLTQVQEELIVANEAVKSLRKSHSALLLNVALQDGRITPATRAKWEDRFQGSEDFTALANELGSIDPVMKTTRLTKGAKPGDNGGATHADVIVMANEMCSDGKVTFESAYARAKKDPRFAHLFQVKQADAQ
jgi:hypothetical protein